MKSSKLVTAILVAGLAVPATALAADRSGDPSRPRADPSAPSRAQATQRSQEQDQLQKALKTGQERSFYKSELERLGYKITAVNRETEDYVEYEVVKGANTFEVQVDFDKGTGKATEVDVATNVWKADETDKAIKGAKPQQ